MLADNLALQMMLSEELMKAAAISGLLSPQEGMIALS